MVTTYIKVTPDIIVPPAGKHVAAIVDRCHPLYAATGEIIQVKSGWVMLELNASDHDAKSWPRTYNNEAMDDLFGAFPRILQHYFLLWHQVGYREVEDETAQIEAEADLGALRREWILLLYEGETTPFNRFMARKSRWPSDAYGYVTCVTDQGTVGVVPIAADREYDEVKAHLMAEGFQRVQLRLTRPPEKDRHYALIPKARHKALRSIFVPGDIGYEIFRDNLLAEVQCAFCHYAKAVKVPGLGDPPDMLVERAIMGWSLKLWVEINRFQPGNPLGSLDATLRFTAQQKVDLDPESVRVAINALIRQAANLIEFRLSIRNELNKEFQLERMMYESPDALSRFQTITELIIDIDQQLTVALDARHPGPTAMSLHEAVDERLGRVSRILSETRSLSREQKRSRKEED